MRTIRDRQLKYGISTGLFLFGILWLISLLLLPERTGSEIERWRESLWLLLGMHFVDISGANLGGMWFQKVNAVDYFTDLPMAHLRILPPIAIAIGAFYTGRKVSQTRRGNYILMNSAAVLYGYLPALAAAFLLSDIQPNTEASVVIFLIVLLAIYVGSTVLNALTGGLPFIGFASLGTIILFGGLILIFGIGLLMEFRWTLVAILSGVVGGASILYSRRSVNSAGDLSRFLGRHKYPILLFSALLIALMLALMGEI